MGTELTVEDLLKKVPEGQTQLFERPLNDVTEERFFSVHMSSEYGPGRLAWHNKPPLDSALWYGSRTIPRVPISTAPDPDVTFEGASKDIVDFYSIGGTHVAFISDRLFNLIEEMDPNSLERRPMAIRAKDAIVEFNMVMPSRNLEALDTNRTDILIQYESYGGQWFRTIKFPKGVVFRDHAIFDVHSFSDIDVRGWYWSRELIDAAKASGIRGLYTIKAGWTTGHRVDFL